MAGAWESAAKRQIAKALYRPAALAQRMLDRDDGPAYRALIVHDVAPENLGKVEWLVRFLRAGCRVLAPADVRSLPAAPAGARSRPRCLLTFDDGFLSQARVARTLLDPYGIKAVFFICPVLIDRAERGDYASVARSLGYAPRVSVPPLMGWREVRALAARGHIIGAHTQTHRRLIGLPPVALEGEIVTCANRLASVVGGPIAWFAYPFGGIDSIDRRALGCVATRYQYCCSGIRGLNTASTPPLAILRDHWDLEAPLPYLEGVLEGALDWRYALARRRLRRMASHAYFDAPARGSFD